MKTGRGVHVNKSPEQRKIYNEYIKSLDYKPTVDQRMHFPQTSQSGEELTSSSGLKRRPIEFREQISDYFKRNWIGLLMIVAIGIMSWLMNDSRMAITKFETTLNSQNNTINNLISKTDSGNDLDHTQNLKIQEISIGLENVREKIEKTDDKIDRFLSSQLFNSKDKK